MSSTIARYPYRDLRPDEVSHGADLNRMNGKDRAVHEWYRFVLSFPPHLVRQYLDHFEAAPGQTVLDPFCGTGTTVVESMRQGLNGIGIEANPIAYLAASVKTRWSVDPSHLRSAANAVAEATLRTLGNAGIRDSGVSSPKRALRVLSADQIQLLIRDSISPLPLHKVMVLLEHIEQSPSDVRDAMRIALARILPTQIGNLRFGPEVGIGKLKPDAAVVLPWLNNVDTMARDLDLIAGSTHGLGKIISGDAREAGVLLVPGSVDFVITSPPYPNEKDYTRTTRLESVLLGLMNDRKGLRSVKQGLIRSNTRTSFQGDDDSKYVEGMEVIQELAAQVEARRISLGKTSGFEKQYAKVITHFFGGMARHLAELRPALRPGAQLAYVVGDQASFFQILIRTGQLLAEVAEVQGYEVVGIDLFRTRAATATRDELREEVLLLRNPE